MPVAESKKCVKIENLKIARDPLHTDNYTMCSQDFQSTIHPEMKKLNKEACEQFNSLLRSVQTSVSYMKFDNYLQAIKIFIIVSHYSIINVARWYKYDSIIMELANDYDINLSAENK